MRVATIFSSIYLEFFQKIFLKTLPKDVKDIRIYFITEFFGSSFGSIESKECGMRKLDVIWENIQSMNDNEILLFVDTDIVFNKNKNLKAEMTSLLADNDVVFIENDSFKINTGIICIRINENTRRFFKEMYDRRFECMILEYNELDLINNNLSNSNIKWLKAPIEYLFSTDYFRGNREKLSEKWIMFHVVGMPDANSKIKFLEENDQYLGIINETN